MDVSPFLALLPIVLLVSLVFFFSTGTKPPRMSLPPSPPGFPLLGHLPLLLGSLPHQKLRAMARTHGPVMLLRLGRVPTVVVSSAAAAQEAIKTRDLAFASRPRRPMLDRLHYGGRDVAFAPYGEHWRQARRFCVLHLLSQRCVLSFRRVREQETAALLDRVRGAGAVNLSHLLVTYSSVVSMRAAFGGHDHSSSRYVLDGEGKTLRKLLGDIVELLVWGPLGETVPWLWWVDSLTGVHAKATRTFEALDALLERGIADHRKRRRDREGDAGDNDDDDDSRLSFASVLLDAKEEGEILFDVLAVKAIILNMFIGGSHTTAAVLEWAMVELINHPDDMHKLQEEIRSAMHGGDNQVTEDDLGKLCHLKPVLKETLRLHTPTPLVPRETVEDTELLGYHVPAGTRVFINVGAIALDPATWERAQEFLPERWLGDGGDGAAAADRHQYALAAGHDFTFLPFGGGRRGCPGAGFAMASVELVLVSLLYHFDWELPAGGPSTADVDEMSGLAVRLKKPLCLVAKPWSP